MTTLFTALLFAWSFSFLFLIACSMVWFIEWLIQWCERPMDELIEGLQCNYDAENYH